MTERSGDSVPVWDDAHYGQVGIHAGPADKCSVCMEAARSAKPERVTERCCEPGKCLFQPRLVRNAVRFIMVCRKVHEEPVQIAYRALHPRDDKPVLDGKARDFNSGNAEADANEVILVAGVITAVNTGIPIRDVEAISKACCPYAMETE